MIVLPDAENCTIISSFVWTKHRDVIDRQTDGETESFQLVQWSILQAMRTCSKNLAGLVCKVTDLTGKFTCHGART